MKTVTTIGLDIAFMKLPPCVVGIEACASSHHWARELTVLGHEMKLMPPAYVKPYVKRQKNDAADAEAICEAVQRPSMRLRAGFLCLVLEVEAVLMVPSRAHKK